MPKMPKRQGKISFCLYFLLSFFKNSVHFFIFYFFLSHAGHDA